MAIPFRMGMKAAYLLHDKKGGGRQQLPHRRFPCRKEHITRLREELQRTEAENKMLDRRGGGYFGVGAGGRGQYKPPDRNDIEDHTWNAKEQERNIIGGDGGRDVSRTDSIL